MTSNLKNIKDDIKEIKKSISELKEAIETLNETCSRMNNHITFVEDTYETLKTPLNFIKNKVESLSVGSKITEEIQYESDQLGYNVA